MLWRRWQTTLERHRESIAVIDHEKGTSWTFGELGESIGKQAPQGPLAVAKGHGIEFLRSTLRAWRDEIPLLPLERDSQEPAVPIHQVPLPPDIVHVKSTSGSTGSPRLVLFTARQLASDADQIVETMGLDPALPNVGVISLAHSYGFSNLVLPLLLHGIPLILCSSPLPETIRMVLASNPAVTLPAVPAMWKAWLRAEVLNDSVKLAISAGAPLSPELERAIYDRHHLKVHNFYGSSECGGIAYDRTSTPRPEGSTTVGTPMAGVRLEQNEAGALRVRSDAVAACYWPEPDSAIHDGSFQTGDLCRLDDAGVHLLGRTGDVINVAGRKVDPAEIEEAIGRVPGIGHCVVFGVESSNRERVEDIIAVYAAPGDETPAADPAELESRLSLDLPGWKMPRRWIREDELAPDTRGKISRHRWRQRYLGQ